MPRIDLMGDGPARMPQAPPHLQMPQMPQARTTMPTPGRGNPFDQIQMSDVSEAHAPLGSDPTESQMPRASAGPVAQQPLFGSPSPPQTSWTTPPGSYGGAPGQYNYSNPRAGNFPTWTPGQGWSHLPATQPAPSSPFDVNKFLQDWITSGGRTNQDWVNYYTAHPEAKAAGYTIPSGPKPGELIGQNGQGWDTVIGSGEGGTGAWANPFGSGGGSPSAAGSGIFNDPATATWERQLNALASRFNQPTQNPDYQPYVDYLRKYFQQLQGPAYSPADMNLIQTQALDPLTQQRDAARKQSTERLAARGITPSSGIAEQSLRDIDRQYEQLATQQRGSFATQAIDRNRQQAQQAAGVGNALNQLETARTATDEQRALQSLSLLFQVPQYADRRLELARGSLEPLNPSSLLSNSAQFGQLGLQQSSQDQNFWALVGQALLQGFNQ